MKGGYRVKLVVVCPNNIQLSRYRWTGVTSDGRTRPSPHKGPGSLTTSFSPEWLASLRKGSSFGTRLEPEYWSKSGRPGPPPETPSKKGEFFPDTLDYDTVTPRPVLDVSMRTYFSPTRVRRRTDT